MGDVVQVLEENTSQPTSSCSPGCRDAKGGRRQHILLHGEGFSNLPLLEDATKSKTGMTKGCEARGEAVSVWR